MGDSSRLHSSDASARADRTTLRGVGVGAGYFSQFHYEAWRRVGGAQILAIADADGARAERAAADHGVERFATDFRAILERERPDFVDVITPPATHHEVCLAAAEAGAHVICQKPLAPTLTDAVELVAAMKRTGVRFMVHENFRFQPWHRQIRRMLDEGAIGRVHSLAFHCRLGDGWGPDAYLARQPYFRQYPRLFMFETGVHFIDTFRYLAGEITRVTAWLRRLNPVIAGEDRALVVFEFADGAVGQLDANRYNEPSFPTDEARYTFGDFLLEGADGSIRLDHTGRITLQRLGEPTRMIDYPHEHRGFAGDCVYFTQQHFVDRLRDGQPFETSGDDYLRTLAVQEAVYQSAERGIPVEVAEVEGTR